MTNQPPILLHTWLRNVAIMTVIIYLEAITIEHVISGPGVDWYWRRIKNGRRKR